MLPDLMQYAPEMVSPIDSAGQNEVYSIGDKIMYLGFITLGFTVMVSIMWLTASIRNNRSESRAREYEQKQVWSLETEEFGTVYAVSIPSDLAGVVKSEEPRIACVYRSLADSRGEDLVLHPHDDSYEEPFTMGIKRNPDDRLDELLEALGSDTRRTYQGRKILTFKGIETAEKERQHEPQLLIWPQFPYTAIAALPKNYAPPAPYAVKAVEQILKE